MAGIFNSLPLALTGTAAPEGDMVTMLMSVLPFVVMFVVFYFMLIRPQRKKEKQEAEMRRSLEVGDEVTTRGGIVGRVCKIKDDIITIECGADKTRIPVQRWAIGAKETKISD